MSFHSKEKQNKYIAGEKLKKGDMVYVVNNILYKADEWIPGKVTPIYVRWLWLDRILCKIFNPFKKL